MTIHLISLGNSTYDRVWPLAQLPTTGGKYHASDYFETGGGMAANAAVAAARLGAQVRYWGRGGDDAGGREMRAEMAAYGVDVSHFRLFAGARSSTSAVMVAQDGERMIVNFRGSGIPDQFDWLPLEQVVTADAAMADIRWVEAAHALFSAARAHGIPTILDGEIADVDAYRLLLPVVDHAIFSEPGLRSFIGQHALDNDDNCVAALQQVRALGCQVAAVTRGAQGCVWLDDAGTHLQPAFAVKVVDTTGAGDAFHGAYAVALAEGGTVAEAMRLASAVGALKCTSPGGRAGLPDRARVEAFLQQQSSNPAGSA